MSQEETSMAPLSVFEKLVSMLAMPVYHYLGLIADPNTGQPTVNLEAAQQAIDMMDVLQEKTRGNLTDTEAQLLKTNLAQLKLLYVQCHDAPARQPQPPPAAEPATPEQSEEPKQARQEPNAKPDEKRGEGPRFHKAY